MFSDFYRFHDYRDAIRTRLRALPNGGRGEVSRMSKHLRLHPSVLSQILKGKRQLTSDQAAATAKYLSLSPRESYYLFLLVEQARSKSPQLRQMLESEAKLLRERGGAARQGAPRATAELDDVEKSVFYSSWIFSAVRLACFIPALQTFEAIAERFGLPKSSVEQIADFLISAGLCRLEGGKLRPAAIGTRLPADSPFFSRHQANWRMRAMERASSRSAKDFFYTSPMAIGAEDADKVRSAMVRCRDEILSILEKSQGEKLYCMNFDWFEI